MNNISSIFQARLPGPLTEELQEELKERKKAKLKRAKERKVIEELKKEEEIEKQKFLELSDREKVIIYNKNITSYKMFFFILVCDSSRKKIYGSSRSIQIVTMFLLWKKYRRKVSFWIYGLQILQCAMC